MRPPRTHLQVLDYFVELLNGDEQALLGCGVGYRLYQQIVRGNIEQRRYFNQKINGTDSGSSLHAGDMVASTHNFSASSSCVMPQAFLALCSRFPKPRGSKPCKGVLLSFILCTLPFGSPPFLLGSERSESQKRRRSSRRQQKPHPKTAVCRFEMRLVPNYAYQQFMLTIVRSL